MALNKDFELSSGVSGNYWKVNSIEIDKVVSDTKVTVGLYKDEGARKAGKTPMHVVAFHIEGDKCGEVAVGNNVTGLVYEWLKARPEFEVSQDV